MEEVLSQDKRRTKLVSRNVLYVPSFAVLARRVFLSDAH